MSFGTACSTGAETKEKVGLPPLNNKYFSFGPDPTDKLMPWFHLSRWESDLELSQHRQQQQLQRQQSMSVPQNAYTMEAQFQPGPVAQTLPRTVSPYFYQPSPHMHISLLSTPRKYTLLYTRTMRALRTIWPFNKVRVCVGNKFLKLHRRLAHYSGQYPRCVVAGQTQKSPAGLSPDPGVYTLKLRGPS